MRNLCAFMCGLLLKGLLMLYGLYGYVNVVYELLVYVVWIVCSV